MLKKLDSLIIKSYIGPFIVTFSISVFLLLMQFLWKYIDDLVGKGLQWNVIGELLLYASSGLVPMALPLATLLASIMTFGNMGEYNELMAIKSSGISLQRIIAPLIAVNILIGVGAFFFSNKVLPYTNLKMGALLYDIRHQRPELNIKKGIFYQGIEGISIKIRDKNSETNMMYGVMIYDHRKRNGNLNVTIADSGSIKVSNSKESLILSLYNGTRYEEDQGRRRGGRFKDYPLKRESFSFQQLLFHLEGYNFNRTNTDLFKHNYQMQDMNQLSHVIDSLEDALFDKKIKFYKRFYASHVNREQERRENVEGEMMDMDSVFNTYSSKNKMDVVAQALSYARSAKTSVINNIAEFKSRMKWINKHKIEWHRKFTLSVACLLLFFIGAPFGAIVRKGGLGLPLVISIVFFLLYYIVSMTGEKSIKAGEISSFQGMWTASFVLLPIGMYLTYKATHDSTLLNISSYGAFINKISNKFKKKVELFEKFDITNQIAKLNTYPLEVKLDDLVRRIDHYNDDKSKSSFWAMYKSGFGISEDEEWDEIINQYNEIYSIISHSDLVNDQFIREQLEGLPSFKKTPYYKVFRVLYVILYIVTLPTFLNVLFALSEKYSIKNRLQNMRSTTLTISSYMIRKGFAGED